MAQACQHGNKTVRLTALSVLGEIKQDTFMRHRHSRIALIESRLSSPQSPQELALQQQASLPGSVSELSQKMPSVTQRAPGSETELSINEGAVLPSSESELSLETRGSDRVRNPNCYVRSYTQGVKDTYVGASGKNEGRLHWPSVLIENLTTVDRDNVEPQLQALPAPLGQQVLDEVAERIGTGEIKNVIAYLLATLKRARNGQFNSTVGAVKRAQQPKSQPPQLVGAIEPVPVQTQGKPQRASAENIARVMAEIRAACKR